MTGSPTVSEAWTRVMQDVQGISKQERNSAQNFNFRGIDTVLNVVGPVLRAHGVTIIPSALDIKSELYTTTKGALMRNTTVHMQYTIIGPAGDSIIGSAWGEASDSGDKSVSKATSVAYRTFLLQSLTVPTDEPDPDLEVHQRAYGPADKARDELRTLATSKGIPLGEVAAWFKAEGFGELRNSNSEDDIRVAIKHFKSKGEAA